MRLGSRQSLHAGTMALILALVSCTRLPPPGTLAPGAGTLVMGDRLFFGRNIPTGGTVSDSAWSVFLAEVVTPRLPAGFTTWQTAGQWRGADGVIAREAGFVLEVEHAQGQPPDSVFAAIATEYCVRFHQEAVLRVRAAAEQWLYRAPSR